MSSFIRAFIITLALFSTCSFVSAQAPVDELSDDIEHGEVGSSMGRPEGTVECFDYYRFGSVQAQLHTDVVGVVSGAPIVFTGTIQNTNQYPVVDGSLYVKVFRARGGTHDANGPDVVDQFLVQSGLTIPAHGSVPVSFSWKVPAYAQSGDYKLATFFTTSRKFNLLGLSFTDDVVGNTVSFAVSGEVKGGVQFDKAGVTVAGQPYFFAAFPPRVSATDAVPIQATIKNTGNSDSRAAVSWTVYQWDSQLRENVVQELPPSSVVVPKGGSVPVSISVSDMTYPVYLAVGTLTWQDTTSIISVRFVRDGVDRTRINFPGIMSYPLKKGQENTLFSCVHNSGMSDIVSGGRLELTLSDMSGNPIYSYAYTGDISGAMMGVAQSFTPKRDYSSFVLDARLYQGNTFVDEAHLVYDCTTLDAAACVTNESTSFLSDSIEYFGGELRAGIAALIVLLLVIFVGVAIRKVTRRQTSPILHDNTIV
jgi:hypothetical protein